LFSYYCYIFIITVRIKDWLQINREKKKEREEEERSGKNG
jgi:hypothetical protein